MKYREPRYRPGERHVKPPQAIGLAGGDPARFDEHNMVELKSLGQRDRDDCQSAIAGHFGFGHGSGAHAPDEYYVIESKNEKVQGMDGAVRSFVEYLYEIART